MGELLGLVRIMTSSSQQLPGQWRAHRVLLVAIAALVWALAGACCAARAATQTFFSTGAEQTSVVPAGVSSVQVVAIGGSGGSAAGVAGGAPARVSADLPVTAGGVLYVEVAGNGESAENGGAGGFNGGGVGAAGGGAGGGGGASDVRSSPRSAGLFPDPRLIVAAAGGGAAEGAGGAAGSNGGEGNAAGEGGGAGTSSIGGTHGTGGCGDGIDGQLGLGGNGGVSSVQAKNGAGGGGGGYYGGGGGGAGCMSGGGGGGGGSSLVPAGGSLIVVAAGTPPQVQLIYTPAPQPDKTPPTITASSKSSRLSRSGAISFFVQSSENATGSAGATLNVPANARVLRFRSRTLKLAAGVKTKVTLRLSKKNAGKARRALKRKRLKAKINLALKDAAGNASTMKSSLRLKR